MAADEDKENKGGTQSALVFQVFYFINLLSIFFFKLLKPGLKIQNIKITCS